MVTVSSLPSVFTITITNAVLAAFALFTAGCADAPEIREGRRGTHADLVGDAKAPALVAMHMQWADNGDWLMSRTAGEGAPSYHYNGIAYRVFEAQPAGRPSLPLYRCTDKFGTHYQTNKFGCESEGSTHEGLLGWVDANDPGDGAKQIWRCIAPSGSPIISTVDQETCTKVGYIVQLSLGWAYPSTHGEATLIPMHMQFADNGDWLMSRTAGEGAPAYRYNGIAFRVLDAQRADKPTLALYRCTDKLGTHYQTNKFGCESEGSTFEGLLGFTYASDPGDGAKAVWRCIAPSGSPIVAQIDPAICTNAGYLLQLQLGWAYAP